jgi:outer membrane receptor for ferrienterochelin and colicins
MSEEDMSSLSKSLTLFFLFSLAEGNAQELPGRQLDVTLDSLLNIEVTTASKRWEKVVDAPASTTVITREDIRSFGYRTLADVLESVRGFYVSYDRNYTYAGTRGFSRPTDYNDRMLLLVNGHTLNDGFNGSAPFGTDFALDLNAVDRIEIVRGPGSVLYGSGAMFALINVITIKGPDLDNVVAGGVLGSHGRRGVSLLAGGEPWETWEGMLSGRWERAEGTDYYVQEFDTDTTNHGIASNLDWDEYFGLMGSMKHKSFSLQSLFSSRRKGIPTGAYAIAFNDQHAQTVDQYAMIEARIDREVAAAGGASGRIYFDHYFYGGTYPYDVPSYDANHVSRWGVEAQYDWVITSSNELTAGLEFIDNYHADYNNQTDVTVLFDGNFPYTAWSVFVQDEEQLAENLSLSVGLRRDEHSRVGNSLSPRAALVYHPDARSNVKVMYGDAFRFPNLYESDYYDVLSNYKVSTNLQRERITTYELEGSMSLTDEVSALVSVYTYTMNNLIDQVADPADTSIQFRNVEKVRASGFEVELTGRWSSGVNAYANYVLQNARDVALGERLTNSPEHIVKWGVQIPVAGIVRSSIEGRYESARKTLTGSRTRDFWITNLTLMTLRGGGSAADHSLVGPCTFSLSVRNIFNERYAYPGGFEHLPAAAIEQDGREFLFRVEWGF